MSAKVAELGRGQPVVFLHGLVGLNEHWEDSARLVSAHARCILFELPLLTLRDEDCSVQGATELTAVFLREHVREPALLVGNSFGGHVALRLAILHPDLVGGLFLAGSSGLLERTMVKDIQIRPSREWLARKIGELFYDPAKMRKADLDRAYAELSQRDHARAMVRLSRSARSDHLADRIDMIRAPTHLLWGREDIVTPPEAAEEFLAKLSDAELTWIEGCGHAPMIEAPEKFAEALIGFIRRLQSRDADEGH